MFKVNNKETRETSMTSFWYLYCWLWAYFTYLPTISIVGFKKVSFCWELLQSCYFKVLKAEMDFMDLNDPINSFSFSFVFDNNAMYLLFSIMFKNQKNFPSSVMHKVDRPAMVCFCLSKNISFKFFFASIIYIIYWGLFRIQSNIYDETFCENSLRPLEVNYFHK